MPKGTIFYISGCCMTLPNLSVYILIFVSSAVSVMWKWKTRYSHCNNLVIGCQRNTIIFKYRSNMKRTYGIMVSSVQQFLCPIKTSVIFFECSFRSVLVLLFRNFPKVQLSVTFSNSDFPCWFQSLCSCFVPPCKVVISMHMNPVG